MSVLKLLTSFGYLPEVLPPCFNSETFGATVARRRNLPQQFLYKGRKPTQTHRLRSHCVRFNQARQGSLRRQFSIPNPVGFFRLAAAISENWATLKKHCESSPFSLTTWTTDRSGKRALKARVDFKDRPFHRAAARATATYLLKADIARCFPSIYTHSIGWALHGKLVSKRNYSDSLLGNLLDVLLQSMQDGQTIGIPTGQDSSRLISEVILSDIDRKLAKARDVSGTRAVDDYEFGFPSLAEAEGFLASLQRELENYELALNPSKTKIAPLPQPLVEAWEVELRAAELMLRGEGSAKIVDRRDILFYFNKALALQNVYPDEGVLRFALSRLHVHMRDADWPVLQDLLLQCAMTEAGTLEQVIDHLLVAEITRGFGLDRKTISRCFNQLIEKNAPLGHSSEVAYAIWACQLLTLKIGRAAASAISVMDDPVIGVLALDARSKRLIGPGFRKANYRRFFQEAELYGAGWILAYEAAVHGWLPSGISSAYVDNEPCFGYLKRKGVRFYRPDYAAEYIAAFQPPKDEEPERSDRYG